MTDDAVGEAVAVRVPGPQGESSLPPPAAERPPHRWLSPAVKRVVSVVGLLLLFAVPTFLGTFTVSVLTQMLAFSVLIGSLVLLLGTAGMPSLGQAAYFGIGGYATGLLAEHLTTSAPLLILCAAGVGLLAAAATGWLLVRSRAGYLLMLTLAIGEILASLANSWADVTGGSDGLAGIPILSVGSVDLEIAGYVYWYVLVAALLLLGLLAAVRRSPFGLTLRGVRDNESRMRALGYPTRMYKYAAFCLAGAVAGAAGSLWVAQVRFISPGDMSFGNSALALVAVIIGGADSLMGGVVGAVVIVAVQNLLPSSFEGRGPLVLGLLLILIVYVLRGGVAALPARLGALLRGRR